MSDQPTRDVWPQIDPEWVDIGFGAFDCECGERVGGIIGAGETCECDNCGRVYQLIVRVEVSEPGLPDGKDQ